MFLGPSPRIMEIKTKLNNWDQVKLTKFCTTKETYKQKDNSWVGRKHSQVMVLTRA